MEKLIELAQKTGRVVLIKNGIVVGIVRKDFVRDEKTETNT